MERGREGGRPSGVEPLCVISLVCSFIPALVCLFDKPVLRSFHKISPWAGHRKIKLALFKILREEGRRPHGGTLALGVSLSLLWLVSRSCVPGVLDYKAKGADSEITPTLAQPLTLVGMALTCLSDNSQLSNSHCPLPALPLGPARC